MTPGADFVRRTGHRGLFARVGREDEPPLAFEHSDAVHSLLVGNDAHDLVGGFAIVVEHGVPGCSGDAVRQLVCAEDHGLHQLFLLAPEIEVPTDAADYDDQDGER